MSTGMPPENGQGQHPAQQAFPQQPVVQQPVAQEPVGLPTPSFEQAAMQPPAPQAQAPVNNPVMDAFASQGYDVTGFGDDGNFMETIQSGLAQLSDLPRLEELAKYGQEYLRTSSGAQETAPGQVEERAPEPPPESNWQPPEYEESWDNLLRVGDDGNFIPVSEHVSPVIAQKANQYREWMRDQGQTFWKQPYEFIQNGIEPWVQQQISQGIEKAFSEREVNGEVEDFISENASRLYDLDSNGQIRHDPVTGEERLSAEGAVLKHYAEEARQGGMTDPRAIQDFSVGMLQRDMYMNQQAAHTQAMNEQADGVMRQQVQQQYTPDQQYAEEQQYTPEQINEMQKQAFLDRGMQGGSGYSPNRDASVASAAEAGIPQNRDLSFLEMATPEMVNQGIMPQTG
jgi:hypothetical protein